MKKKGLTLIELLIATSIFSLIALSLYSALQAGILTYNKMDSAFSVYQSARILLARIGRDLNNTFIYSIGDSNFKGSPGELDFFSTVDTFENGENSPGISRIKYSFANGSLNRSYYGGIDAIKANSDSEGEELSSDIREIVFEYAYPTNNPEMPYIWQDAWPEPNDAEQKKGLPMAVKIRLLMIERNRQKEPSVIEFNRIIPLHINS